MNISIVTGPCFPVPPLEGGSIPRLWQGLAEEFAACGHNVNIICRSYPGQSKSEVINGVNYFRAGGFSQSRHVTLDLMKDLIYAFGTIPKLPKADILVINDFWLPALAPILRRDAGLVVINVARFPKRQFFLYSKTARFAAVSHAIKDGIVTQHEASASRTRVIPNPVDARIFSPPASGRQMKPNATILYVGRVHPEKGVHMLIDAFKIASKQVPKARLHILGPFKESQGGGGHTYNESLKSQAQGLNVEFLDPIFDLERLADAYRSADVFCYPSLAEKGEALPVAPLEAMASGLVPVVSDLDCFKDVITQNETGYFFDHRVPDRAHKLADVLTTTILNPEKSAQISACAIERAKQFNYQSIAEMYLQDFASLLETRNSSSDPNRASASAV